MYKYVEITVGSPRSGLVDVINSMVKQGYEFVQVIPCGSGPNGDHLVLFRKWEIE